MSVLKTDIRLLFTEAEKDISSDIAPDLLSFSYSDKETDEADEITITLMDPDGKWASAWKPDGGETVRASIIKGVASNPLDSVINAVNGEEGTPAILSCGKFYIDSLRTSGSPRVMEIKGVSIPLNTPIRRKTKTKAWEKTSLKSIAVAIAGQNGVNLMWDVQENPSFDRTDQKQESDLEFLSRLCKDNGLSIKVADNRIVIFDQASYEKKTPVRTYILNQSEILNWRFESAQSEKYRSVTVSYRDPRQKKRSSAGSHKIASTATVPAGQNPAVHSYTYTDPEVDKNAQEYQMKKRATSIAQAQILAKNKLRELNRRAVTGNMTVVGDVLLVAGVVITCSGFGSFDGNFIIESATHSVTGSGYTTAVSMRRVNTVY